MIDIIENFLNMVADIINKIFLFEVEFSSGEYIPIGKVVVAFVFIAVSLYLILDAFGILGGDE